MLPTLYTLIITVNLLLDRKITILIQIGYLAYKFMHYDKSHH